MQSTPRHQQPSGSISAASTLVHTPLVHKCLVYLGDLSRYHATVSALPPDCVHTRPHITASLLKGNVGCVRLPPTPFRLPSCLSPLLSNRVYQGAFLFADLPLLLPPLPLTPPSLSSFPP